VRRRDKAAIQSWGKGHTIPSKKCPSSRRKWTRRSTPIERKPGGGNAAYAVEIPDITQKGERGAFLRNPKQDLYDPHDPGGNKESLKRKEKGKGRDNQNLFQRSAKRGKTVSTRPPGRRNLATEETAKNKDKIPKKREGEEKRDILMCWSPQETDPAPRQPHQRNKASKSREERRGEGEKDKISTKVTWEEGP